MAFVEVAAVSDIPKGTMKSVSAGIWQVLVINVDGRFYAMNNACPHQGWSLAEGTLIGKTLTCKLDGAKFDVATASASPGPGHSSL
jgi:nitrite reductase/ring-hydroxylating ferredoxin subunit